MTIDSRNRKSDNPVKQTRVRLPETIETSLFGGWGIRL